MREKRAFVIAGRKGFISAEMVLLLIMLVVFLAGVVLLVNGGVSTFDAAKGQTRLSDESARILNRIGAMLSSARTVSLAQPSLEPAFNSRRLVFTADLDGAGGKPETVALYRPSSRPGELVALVGDRSEGARKVILTSMLDPASRAALKVEYYGEAGDRFDTRAGSVVGARVVGSIRVRIRLLSGGDTRSYGRLFHLPAPLPSEQLSPGADFR